MARSGGMTVSRVSVTTSATLLSAAAKDRESVLIRPITGDIYVGDANTVTTNTGFLVKQDEALTLDNNEAVWGIAAGTVAVSVLVEA